MNFGFRTKILPQLEGLIILYKCSDWAFRVIVIAENAGIYWTDIHAIHDRSGGCRKCIFQPHPWNGVQLPVIPRWDGRDFPFWKFPS